jgi:hypothetical protein
MQSVLCPSPTKYAVSLHVVERMKKSSPWRALQGESRFWVIAQVAQNSDLWPLAKQARSPTFA